MLAYDYPLLGIFWTLLWFYIIIAWFMVLFSIIADIFRAQEMSGLTKALWLLVILFIPFLGVLFYLIANGNEMAARKIALAQAQDDALRAYYTAGPGAVPVAAAAAAPVADTTPTV